ncbi:MAG: ATP-binding protein [Pseudomonadota bacterium]
MDLAAYFRSVMALSHGIVVTLDTDGRVIHGNTLLEQTTGYRITDMMSEDWFELVIPEADRQREREQFARCTRQSDIHTFRGRIRRRDRQIVHIEWRLKPLADAGSGMPGVMMVGHDITGFISGRQHLIRECADLLERNRELTCLYGVARIVENTDRALDDILHDIIALVPPALQRPQEASVALIVDERRLHTPGYDTAAIRFEQEILVGNIHRGRLCVATATLDGAPHLAQTREEVELIAVVARQVGLIISKKEALDSQQDLQMQLRHADRLAKVGQLAAGVAHELNEPLANILGFAQLAAKEDGLAPQVTKDLEHIVRSALHARDVIKKLMLFSRQVPPRKSPTDLNGVIEDALYFSASSAVRQGVTVDCQLAPELPSITADPQQLKQVVINLSTNAIQAMPDGGTLTIQTHASAEHVFMSVADNGCGMAAETIEQIFTPFFTTKDIDQGSGLGLSVAHGIVRAHGGSIDVHSRVGEGSTFTLSFPLTT